MENGNIDKLLDLLGHFDSKDRSWQILLVFIHILGSSMHHLIWVEMSVLPESHPWMQDCFE